MKIALLETLKPLCPACREARVAVSHAVRGDDRELLEGVLLCANGRCRREYPVIDGIPILVRDQRTFFATQLFGVMARDDLSETTLGLVGECSGPSSPLDALRQMLSTYVGSHYEDPAPAIATMLDRGLARVPALGGPILDVGCSVGRGTFHLAATMREGPVLGVDLNFAKLRVARRALLDGAITYARRRVGLAYEPRTVAADLPGRDRVDFWCADALALPFAPGTFGFAASLNVLDCVTSPRDHLVSLRDVLRVGGAAVLATPFDWSALATPPEAWLGGHSARGVPESERILRELVAGEHPARIDGLALLAEEGPIDWPLRLHARSVTSYAVDLFVLGRVSGAA